jgi:uroporphyrinogen-III synthase
MRDKTVAILESRSGDQVASLIRKRGGTPLLAPALAEVPDADPSRIRELIHGWDAKPPGMFIFQTGAGTRSFFTLTDSLGLTDTLLRALDKAQVVARGPKPATVLRSRNVRIDRAAGDPFTTHEVLAEIGNEPLRGKTVVVQRYGEPNHELMAALENLGAEPTEVATYRWALPEDTAPLLKLIEALDQGKVDLAAFTSAAQATNLFAVAEGAGQETALQQGLARTLVASIGPVCSRALRKLGVRIDIEAKPPKLGPFIEAIDAALSGLPRPGET